MPLFTNKFYSPITDDQQIITYEPNRHGRTIKEFKEHRDFEKFKKHYEEILDKLYIFSENHQISYLEKIKNNFEIFKEKIFLPEFCDKNPGIIWNSAREILEQIIDLLNNKQISLTKRNNAVAQLAEEITVCAEGTVSKIENIFSNLQLELLSSADFFQKKKEKLVEQFIIEFVSSRRKSWSIGMEVHFVNAYFNAIAGDFGLTTRKHEQTIQINSLLPQDIQNCLQFVKTEMDAKYFVAQLANEITLELEEILIAFTKKQTIPAEIFQDEVLMRQIDDILARANKRYNSKLTLHHFLAPTDNEAEYERVQDQRRVQLLIAQGLQKQKLLQQEGNKVVQQTAEGTVYSFLNQWFWLHTQDSEEKPLTVKQLEELVAISYATDNDQKKPAALTAELIEQSSVESLTSLPLRFFRNGSNLQLLGQKLGQEEFISYLNVNVQDLNNFRAIFSNQCCLFKFIDTLPKVARVLTNKMIFLNENNQFSAFNNSVANQFFVDMLLNRQGFSATRFSVLMKAGADINTKDNEGRSLLSYSAEYYPKLAMDLLNSHNTIDINSKDKNSNTPLIYAIKNNQIVDQKKLEELVEKLINSKNIDLDAKNNQGQTALTIARKKSGKILNLIEKALLVNVSKNLHPDKDPVGKIVDLCNTLGDKTVACYFSKSLFSPNGTPLAIPLILPSKYVLFNCFKQYPATFSTLQEKVQISSAEVKPLSFDNAMVNYFWLECIKIDHIGNDQKPLEILKALIKLDADINAADSEGKTALMYAAIIGQLDIIELLIQQPTLEVNAVDNNSRNALMWAAQKNNQEVVQRLLEYPEVNLKQVDNEGNNAYLLAPKVNVFLRDMIIAKSKAPAIEATFEIVHAEDIPACTGVSALQQACSSSVNNDEDSDFIFIDPVEVALPLDAFNAKAYKPW